MPSQLQVGMPIAAIDCHAWKEYPMNLSIIQPIEPASGRAAKPLIHHGRHGCWSWNRILAAALVLGLALNAQSATYYVDFSAGSDANNGTSANTPWQHCPADGNATSVVAAATLHAGDVINFKGGVVYNVNASHGINEGWSGTSNSPIVFQSAPGWGTGRAVMEGTVGGATNNYAFTINGNWCVISGFEIKDFSLAGIYIPGADGTIVSNNVIHHIGMFPVSAGSGDGVNAYSASDLIVVSNLLYDLDEYCVNTPSYQTNLIFWGNEVHDCYDHGWQPYIKGGYFVSAFNYYHDMTNQTAHGDALHLLGLPVGSTAIIANDFYQNNVDDINVEMFTSTNSGTIYIFNNISSQTHPGSDGLQGFANGCTAGTDYGNVAGLYVWNNTFVDHNAGWGGFKFLRQGEKLWTNSWFYNNLFYNSIYYNGAAVTNFLNFKSDYNCFINPWRNNGTVEGAPGYGNNAVTLAQYQAAAPGYEVHSVSGGVTFAGYTYSNGVIVNPDYHLTTPSVAIGAGTNLSALFNTNTFSFLPPRYRLDPTKDADGKQRGANWDIGAYQYSTNAPGSASVQPLPPTGLIAKGQ